VVAGVTLVFALTLAGCQTTPQTNGEQDTMPESANGNGDEAPAEGRQRFEVTVEGAEGTREGSVLTIDYPDLPQTKNDILPDWVINPSLGGVLGAVGVARPHAFGTKEQLNEARLNARLELANTLEARFQNVGRGQLEQQLATAGDALVDDSRKSFLGVDRTIADVVLAGTRQRALWFDPDNGEVFVWMVVDGAVLDRVDHYLAEEVSVFIANTPVKTEYRPQRRKLPEPKVIIRGVEQPEPEPEPLEPVEELEGKLKDIETVPLKEDDGS
jgi:hypothetical protein